MQYLQGKYFWGSNIFADCDQLVYIHNENTRRNHKTTNDNTEEPRSLSDTEQLVSILSILKHNYNSIEVEVNAITSYVIQNKTLESYISQRDPIMKEIIL